MVGTTELVIKYMCVCVPSAGEGGLKGVNRCITLYDG